MAQLGITVAGQVVVIVAGAAANFAAAAPGEPIFFCFIKVHVLSLPGLAAGLGFIELFRLSRRVDCAPLLPAGDRPLQTQIQLLF